MASALGVGGKVGTLLSGATVGKSNTVGSYESTTVTEQDLPILSIGPHGNISMSKQYIVDGIGINVPWDNFIDTDYKATPLKFSVSISYSFEESGESDKLTTNFYVNSNINCPTSDGNLADGYKTIYLEKPDALAEYLYIFKIDTKIFGYINYIHGILLDYK